MESICIFGLFLIEFLLRSLVSIINCFISIYLYPLMQNMASLSRCCYHHMPALGCLVFSQKKYTISLFSILSTKMESHNIPLWNLSVYIFTLSFVFDESRRTLWIFLKQLNIRIKFFRVKSKKMPISVITFQFWYFPNFPPILKSNNNRKKLKYSFFGY